MKILVDLPEWQYKEIKGDKGISEGVMINALYAIRIGKLVEQEPIIDKIRAEIDGLKKDSLISWASSEMIISTILNIIDKYKAETE